MSIRARKSRTAPITRFFTIRTAFGTSRPLMTIAADEDVTIVPPHARYRGRPHATIAKGCGGKDKICGTADDNSPSTGSCPNFEW
jgi:hypothetical protein